MHPEISFRLSPYFNMEPYPPGPGFPLQAPSVKISTIPCWALFPKVCSRCKVRPDYKFNFRLFLIVGFKGQESPVCFLASRYGLERDFVFSPLFDLFQVVFHFAGKREFCFTEYKRFTLRGPYFCFFAQVLTFRPTKEDVSGAW